MLDGVHLNVLHNVVELLLVSRATNSLNLVGKVVLVVVERRLALELDLNFADQFAPVSEVDHAVSQALLATEAILHLENSERLSFLEASNNLVEFLNTSDQDTGTNKICDHMPFRNGVRGVDLLLNTQGIALISNSSCWTKPV